MPEFWKENWNFIKKKNFFLNSMLRDAPHRNKQGMREGCPVTQANHKNEHPSHTFPLASLQHHNWQNRFSDFSDWY